MDEIYSYRREVRPVDQDLIPFGSVDKHMNQGTSLETLQDWCSDTYPAVLASAQLARQFGVQNNARIEDYLLAETGSHSRAMPYPRFRWEPGAG